MSRAEKYDIIKSLLSIKNRKLDRESSERTALENYLYKTIDLTKHDDLVGSDTHELVRSMSAHKLVHILEDILVNLAKAVKLDDAGKFAPTQKLQNALANWDISEATSTSSQSRSNTSAHHSRGQTDDPEISSETRPSKSSSQNMDKSGSRSVSRQEETTPRSQAPSPTSSLSAGLMNSQKVEILKSTLVDFENEKGISLPSKDVTKAKVFDLKKAEIDPLAVFFLQRFGSAFQQEIHKTGRNDTATTENLKKALKDFRIKYLTSA